MNYCKVKNIVNLSLKQNYPLNGSNLDGFWPFKAVFLCQKSFDIVNFITHVNHLVTENRTFEYNINAVISSSIGSELITTAVTKLFNRSEDQRKGPKSALNLFDLCKRVITGNLLVNASVALKRYAISGEWEIPGEKQSHFHTLWS